MQVTIIRLIKETLKVSQINAGNIAAHLVEQIKCKISKWIQLFLCDATVQAMIVRNQIIHNRTYLNYYLNN
jgi:hypothetical protein